MPNAKELNISNVISSAKYKLERREDCFARAARNDDVLRLQSPIFNDEYCHPHPLPLSQRERGVRTFLEHWYFNTALFGEFDCLFVARVGVADDAHAGVAGEDALEPEGSGGGSVGDDDLSGVDGIADADSAATVNGDPCRAVDGVYHGVEERPVRDGIAAVLHGFGLAAG